MSLWIVLRRLVRGWAAVAVDFLFANRRAIRSAADVIKGQGEICEVARDQEVNVTSIMRKLKQGLFLAALGSGLGGAVLAQEPAPWRGAAGQAMPFQQQPSMNQLMAERIGQVLRQNGNLRGYNVNILFVDGIAEVAGTVVDQPQREEVLRIVQGTQGVNRVYDRMAIGGVASIKQVQGSGNVDAGSGDKSPLLAPPPDFRAPPPQPQAAGEPGDRPGEPAPIFQAPPPSAMDVGSARMPPYAWPTYAPYNNFSRVAYPLAYPYSSWPFIGPPYPFPKIPPGWRSVKLEWEDGYWWFSKVENKHDWWHLRYW